MSELTREDLIEYQIIALSEHTEGISFEGHSFVVRYHGKVFSSEHLFDALDAAFGFAVKNNLIEIDEE